MLSGTFPTETNRTLGLWIAVPASLGGGLVIGASRLATGGGVAPHEAPALDIANGEGVALLALCAFYAFSLLLLSSDTSGEPSRARRLRTGAAG